MLFRIALLLLYCFTVHGQDASRIAQSDLKAYLTFIASDEMEGRDTPSRGLDITAKYIASHLEEWGVLPMGDNGTYFQHFDVNYLRVRPETKIVLNGKAYPHGESFYVYSTGHEAGTYEGGLVYAQYGWVYKQRNMNPYEGLDVAGKIIVIQDKFPYREEAMSGKSGVDWESPWAYAKRNGAKGILYLTPADKIGSWASDTRKRTDQGLRIVEANSRRYQGCPELYVSPAMIELLFAGEKFDAAQVYRGGAGNFDTPSFILSKRLSITTAFEPVTYRTQNIVAVVPGIDSRLKNEFVAIGAHYDHIGVDNPVNGDSINNGADDDGSGTVAVMSIAKAFGLGKRPARSILFVWHAGEEKGLLGSAYFTDHPTVPIDKIVTQLNIDMVGRSRSDTLLENRNLSGPGEIYTIGSMRLSSELGAICEKVNRSTFNLVLNNKYDDPDDPERFYERSDHYNYAKKGIPIAFFFNGPHVDYHEPSDSVEKIDFEKLFKVTRTVYAIAWEVARRKTRPALDYKEPTR